MQNYEGELQRELEKVYESIRPYSDQNRFKAMLYNLAPPNFNLVTLQNNRYQPKPGTNEPYLVDASLFTEALTKNPDPQRLYPVQVNSCKELSDRINFDNSALLAYSENLQKLEKTLREKESELKGQCSQKLKEARENQNKLLEKLCYARSKLERFLELKNALDKNSGNELKLRARIDQLAQKLQVGAKLDKLKTYQVHSRTGVEIPEEHKNEVYKVLGDTKKNIEELKNIVRNDSKKVQKIENYLTRQGNY